MTVCVLHSRSKVDLLGVCVLHCRFWSVGMLSAISDIVLDRYTDE